MSYPTVPNVELAIDLSTEDSVNLLLASIAFEELALAHIMNAEAEKIQYVLGTLEGQEPPATPPTLEELLEIDRSVIAALRTVIKKEMLLQFKLEDTLTISTTTTTTTTTSTSTTDSTTTEEPVNVGSAWSVGTDFGTGNAQYTSLGAEEQEKTVVLGLGANYIPVGTVHMLRVGNNLEVTISTVFPYLMDAAHLYVDDTPPVDSAPGLFPYKYEPGAFFTTHTFTVDVSAFAGNTIYIAAHATVFTQ